GALALTLAIAVLLSMIMSLTLIPVLASVMRYRKPKYEAAESDIVGRTIRWLVGHREIALALIAALVVGGYFAQRQVPIGFLPQMDEGAFVIDFFAPSGTALEETDRISRGIDDVLSHRPEVKSFTRRTGTELGPATATLQSRGDIMVRLVPRSKRDDIL